MSGCSAIWAAMSSFDWAAAILSVASLNEVT